MRDPERIPKTLFQIERVWECYPDLRLGQRILNSVNANQLYYMEDEELIQRLFNFAAENFTQPIEYGREEYEQK